MPFGVYCISFFVDAPWGRANIITSLKVKVLMHPTFQISVFIFLKYNYVIFLRSMAKKGKKSAFFFESLGVTF